MRISGWLVAGCPDPSGSCPGRHRLGKSGGEALGCRSSLARGHAASHKGPSLAFTKLRSAPRNSLDNPFPWVSGIVPIEGANAYGSWGRGNDKWGVVVRFTLQ